MCNETKFFSDNPLKVSHYDEGSHSLISKNMKYKCSFKRLIEILVLNICHVLLIPEPAKRFTYSTHSVYFAKNNQSYMP